MLNGVTTVLFVNIGSVHTTLRVYSIQYVVIPFFAVLNSIVDYSIPYNGTKVYSKDCILHVIFLFMMGANERHIPQYAYTVIRISKSFIYKQKKGNVLKYGEKYYEGLAYLHPCT